MSKNKKLFVATLLAVPAVAVVAESAQAADTTTEKTLTSLNIHNSFLPTSNVTTQTSTKNLTATDEDDLAEKIIMEMATFNRGFTITYDGTATNYSQHVEKVFNEIKQKLNTSREIGELFIDYTTLYGAFKNAKVDAEEIKTVTTVEGEEDTVVTVKVKLKFSIDYNTNQTNETALNALISSLTSGSGSASLFPDSSSELKKVKAIHDYIVLGSSVSATQHSAAVLSTTKAGSAHAYSMLAYRLLKAAKIEVRYIVGYTSGALHMWNAVKVGERWYYLDTVFDDDKLDKSSKSISYRYFLTPEISGRTIETDITVNTGWGNLDDYENFHQIVNPTQVRDTIYYANAERNGDIYKLDVSTKERKEIALGATTGYGNMIYYAYTDLNDTEQKNLYFINHAQGSYLYRFDLTNSEVVLVDNVAVESIALEYAKLKYKTVAGENREINLGAIDEFISEKAEKVVALITALNETTPNTASVCSSETSLSQFNKGTGTRDKVTNTGDLTAIEEALIETISTTSIKNAVMAINKIDPLDPGFYNLVEDAKSQYESLTGSKTAVYNKKILDDALLLTAIVDEMNEEVETLSQLAGEDIFDNPARPTIITEVEELGIKYDNLLPSLKNAVDVSAKAFLDTYQSQLQQLKANVEEVKSLMNAINYNSAMFVTVIEELQPKYDALKMSQKARLTTAEKTKIDSAIATATSYYNQAKTFADMIQAWPVDVSGKPTPTKTKLDSARQQYIGFNEAIKVFVDRFKVDEVNYSNLDRVPTIFDEIINFDPATLAVIKLIEALDETVVAMIDAKYRETGQAYENLTADQKTQIENAGLGYGTPGRLGEVKAIVESAVSQAKDFDEEVIALQNNEDRTPVEIEAVRTKYNSLSAVAKSKVKVDSLTILEGYTAVLDAAALDAKILDLNNNSTTEQVKLVRDDYEAALQAVKKEVKNLEHLHQFEAKPLITKINSLQLTPTWEQIKAVRDEFKALYDGTKEFIQKKEALVLLETAEATHINGLIEKLTDASLASHVQLIRDHFNSLTDGAKAKVKSENMVILKDYEDRLIDGDEKAVAQEVDDLIIAIDLTTATKAELQVVVDAYNKLSTKEQGYVKETERLQQIRDAIKAVEDKEKENADNLEKAKKEAEAIKKLIDVLNSRSSEEDVKVARDAYTALSELAKQQITEATLQKLVDTENDLKNMEYKALAVALDNKILGITEENTLAEVIVINNEYTAAHEEVKKLMREAKRLEEWLKKKNEQVTETNAKAQAEALIIVNRIDRITTSTTSKALRDIRIAYDALSDLAKSYVTNLARLVEYEAYQKYQDTVVAAAKLEAVAFDSYMAKLNRNSTTNEIAKARAYYNVLSWEAKRHVTTYEKLVHLETMWSDPDYINLYVSYYPHYIGQQPSGGIEITKPTFDPLYIPDAVASLDIQEGVLSMDYRNGGYTATIFATDVTGIEKQKLTLSASSNIELALPITELKALKDMPVTVGATLGYKTLTVNFTEGYTAKTFSDFVEITVSASELSTTKNAAIFRKLANGKLEAVSYQLKNNKFIIKTKTGGTFVAETVSTGSTVSNGYNDTRSNVNRTYINELAKRGIVSGDTKANYYPNQNITRGDFAIMIARAANLTSTSTTKFTDVSNTMNANLIQAVSEAGIMKGPTTTRFNINGTITREEAAVALTRLFRHLKMDVALMHNEQQSSFKDIATLTYESKNSIALIELLGIFDTSGTKFNPSEKLTRAQFAKILYKAMEAAKLM